MRQTGISRKGKNMTTKEFYDSIGEDYGEVLSRLGADGTVRYFALKFLRDPSFNDLKQAVDGGDGNAAFRAVHTLKGVCLNLGFFKLGSAAGNLTEYLRGGKQLDDGSRKMYDAVVKEYGVLTEALKKFAASNAQ